MRPLPRLGLATVNAIDSEPVLEARARASGSSFYLAMRLMPREQRQAMFEIYSFCRAVDDIADNGGPRDVRLAQLQRWRRDVDAIYAGASPPRLQPLAGAIRTFDLRRDDFLTVIDGMQMDVIAPIRAPDWATLDLYCDRVASAVGRLCVRVFKMEDAPGVALAHHLGRALQLTNILRDIDEDAGIGRLYLPQEALSAAGITSTEPLEAIANPAIDCACAPVVARAQRPTRRLDRSPDWRLRPQVRSTLFRQRATLLAEDRVFRFRRPRRYRAGCWSVGARARGDAPRQRLARPPF